MFPRQHLIHVQSFPFPSKLNKKQTCLLCKMSQFPPYPPSKFYYGICSIQSALSHSFSNPHYKKIMKIWKSHWS